MAKKCGIIRRFFGMCPKRKYAVGNLGAVDDIYDYEKVYHIIAVYAGHLLPLYADRWSRFPRSDIALTIGNDLLRLSRVYARTPTAIELERAGKTVLQHIEG